MVIDFQINYLWLYLNRFELAASFFHTSFSLFSVY